MNLQMAQLQYEEVTLKLLLLQAEYEKQLQLFLIVLELFLPEVTRLH